MVGTVPCVTDTPAKRDVTPPGIQSTHGDLAGRRRKQPG